MEVRVRLKEEVAALAQTCLGFMLLMLMLLGIAGTIYKIVSPEGWVAQAFGRSLSAGVATVGSLLMVFGLAWFSRGWSWPRRRNRFADLLVYVFATAGLLYIAQLWVEGTF